MKILLFYPNLYGMNLLPPAIGLFYSILKKEGFEVRLFDTTMYPDLLIDNNIHDMAKAKNLNAREFDDSIFEKNKKKSNAKTDFIKIVQDFAPDLIAMSATESMYMIGINLLKQLGGLKPIVVAGGVFPTCNPELALKVSDGTVNYIIRGEGEATLPQFCNYLKENRDISVIPGICMINDDGKTIISDKLSIADINENPLPDYSIFDDIRFYKPMQGKTWRMLPIETNRGCPFKCGFCNSPTQAKLYKNNNKKFFRKKKLTKIFEEIVLCRDEYKANFLFFWADTFLSMTLKEFDEFCEMYSEIKIPFWMQARIETITEHHMKKLKSVGLLRINFGIEHGDEDFRASVLKKKIKNDLLIKNINMVAKFEIPIGVNNIVGFPTETRQLAFKTIELNRILPVEGMNAYTFIPFHGTPLRKLSEDLSLIDKNVLTSSLSGFSPLNMPYFSKNEIEGIRRCFVLYVKMPPKFWPQIKKAEELTPEGDRIWEELKEECKEKYIHY